MSTIHEIEAAAKRREARVEATEKENLEKIAKLEQDLSDVKDMLMGTARTCVEMARNSAQEIENLQDRVSGLSSSNKDLVDKISQRVIHHRNVERVIEIAREVVGWHSSVQPDKPNERILDQDVKAMSRLLDKLGAAVKKMDGGK